MTTARHRRRLFALLALTAVVAACSGPVAGRSPAVTPDAGRAAATLEPDSRDTPGSADDASPPASARATPPVALLEGTAAGAAVPGTLGSWTLAGGAPDSPWLPGAVLTGVGAAAGARLIVRFADGTRIGFWQAAYAAAGDAQGTDTRGLGGRDMESPALGDVIPDALGPGDWVLSVRLGLGGGGSATYYWRLRVT